MATVIPRSLNDPVGLSPSYFRYTVAPTRSDSRGAGSNGVLPSCSVTTGVASDTGRNSRYSSINPRQPVAVMGRVCSWFARRHPWLLAHVAGGPLRGPPADGQGCIGAPA